MNSEYLVYLNYISWYIIVFVITLAINAVFAGYHGSKIMKEDLYDSIIWPISLLVLFGYLAKLFIERWKRNYKK